MSVESKADAIKKTATGNAATIFYGISSENNVARNINKWIDMAGGVPDVFVEKDENLHKYTAKLLNKYDVVSLDEALRRHPDAHVWVTWRNAGATAKYLPTRLPPERIHFLEMDLEYRKGCRYLGHFMSYRKDSFSPCCVTGQAPIIETSGTVRERFAQWQDYTTKLVDDIRHERPNDCEKCYLLKQGFYPKSVKLNEINFGSNQPGDICNFRCVYCFCAGTLQRLRTETDGYTTYEVLKQLSEMPEFDTEDFIIQLANGEFCANKHHNEMLDVLLKTKWRVTLLSNFSLYREKLATLLQTGRVRRLLISIDAGTRETFKAVKQNDLFDRVIQNLRKYPVDRTNLLLKYVFLDGVNDNEVDVDGFYEIAKEVGATIVLSSDLSKPWTDRMRELALRIIAKSKADGIEVSSNSSYLHPKDVKFVERHLALTSHVKRVGLLRYHDKPDLFARSLFAQAQIRGVDFFYFTPDKINMTNKTIDGLFWDTQSGDYKIKTTPFPEVVDDFYRFRFDYPDIFKELKKTSIILYQRLGVGKFKSLGFLKNTECEKYLTPTYLYKDADIDSLLSKHKALIIKPNRGHKGQSIYKLWVSDNVYSVSIDDEISKMSKEDFFESYSDKFNKDYIIQPYIKSVTNTGLTFNARVNVARGKDAGWAVKKIFFFLSGTDTSVASNPNNGGSMALYPESYMPVEFGSNWREVYNNLLFIASNLPEIVQKHYNVPIDSFSFDVGIDRQNDNACYIFEINTYPATRPFDFEISEARMYFYQYLLENYNNVLEMQNKSSKSVD